MKNLQKLAKVVDAHGVIELRMRIQRELWNPMITFQFEIIHRDFQVMKWLLTTYGGHVYLSHDVNQFTYIWYVNRTHGVKILKEIYPFLVNKKLQAKIYLDCVKRDEQYIVDIDGRKLTKDSWTHQMSDWEHIVKLNLPQRNNKLQKDFTFFMAQIKKFFTVPVEAAKNARFDEKLFSIEEWSRIILQLYYDVNLNSTEIENCLGCPAKIIKSQMQHVGILR